MNKSDIMKAAEKYRVVEPENITLGSWLEVLEALQAAAELLKQVEVDYIATVIAKRLHITKAYGVDDERLSSWICYSDIESAVKSALKPVITTRGNKMNDEMREAFLSSSDDGAYTPEELKIREGGFQAAYQLQQKKIEEQNELLEMMGAALYKARRHLQSFQYMNSAVEMAITKYQQAKALTKENP